MSEFTPPLRRITGRRGEVEILECGHEQTRRSNPAMRRRCVQCRRTTVTVRERAEASEGLRCPFCFDGFESEEETWTCSRCSVRLHEECHEEQGGCTSLGCRSRPVIARPRTPTVTTVTTIPTTPPVPVERSVERQAEPEASPWGVLASYVVLVIVFWLAASAVERVTSSWFLGLFSGVVLLGWGGRTIGDAVERWWGPSE